MTFNINAQVRLLPPTNGAQIAAQLRSQLNNINATIGVNVSAQGMRNLNKANSGLKSVAKNAKVADGAMSDFGKQIALAGKRFFAFSLATAGIVKFTGAIKESLSEAIAFERELFKISQVTGNSIGALKGLTNEITKLSTAWGVSSSLPEQKAKAKLTAPQEPEGAGDKNAYQFGNSNPMRDQSAQLPYFS